MADEVEHPLLREMEERRLREEAFRAADRRSWARWQAVDARLDELSRYGHTAGWDWTTVRLEGWDDAWLRFGEAMRDRPDLVAVYEDFLTYQRKFAQHCDEAQRTALRALEGMWEAALQGESARATLRGLVAVCDRYREVYERVNGLFNDVRNRFVGAEGVRVARELYDEFPDLAAAAGLNRPADHVPEQRPNPPADIPATNTPVQPPPPSVQGVYCELESHSIWLDGKKIAENIDPTAFRVFEKIAESHGDIVKGAVLRKLPGLAGSKLSRVFKRLPAAVRKLIRSKPAGNGGYWLQLPGSKSRP